MVLVPIASEREEKPVPYVTLGSERLEVKKELCGCKA
jgi:hypothetical protein